MEAKLLLGILLIIVGLAGRVEAGDSPVCLDEEGNPVDWFIGYKFPHLSKEGHPFDTGYAYAYFTSEDAAKAGQHGNTLDNVPENDGFIARFRSLLNHYIGFPLRKKGKRNSNTLDASAAKSNGLQWKFSERILTDPKSLVMRTLSVGYDNEDINFILYNDDPSMTEQEVKARREMARLISANQRAKKLEQKHAGLKPKKPKAARRKPEEAKADDDEDLIDVGDQPQLGSPASSPKRSYAKAHAKGVVFMSDDDDGGIWLTHSFPQFPPHRARNLSWPENTARYGQTFMCISFSVKDTGKKIVEHLANMNPDVYEFDVSDKLNKMIPEFDRLDPDVKEKVTRLPKLQQKITTKGGQSLNLYSKSTLFYGDVYSDWIDRDLETTLFVESWRQGHGHKLDSICPPNDYHVNNVKDLKFVGEKSITWTYNQDHSKWAISEGKDKGYFCISDSNRMMSQFKRGSGAVCMACPSCWSVFSNTIVDVEPCPVNRLKSNVHEDTSTGFDWQWIEHLRKYF